MEKNTGDFPSFPDLEILKRRKNMAEPEPGRPCRGHPAAPCSVALLQQAGLQSKGLRAELGELNGICAG